MFSWSGRLTAERLVTERSRRFAVPEGPPKSYADKKKCERKWPQRLVSQRATVFREEQTEWSTSRGIGPVTAILECSTTGSARSALKRNPHCEQLSRPAWSSRLLMRRWEGRRHQGGTQTTPTPPSALELSDRRPGTRQLQHPTPRWRCEINSESRSNKHEHLKPGDSVGVGGGGEADSPGAEGGVVLSSLRESPVLS